MRKAPAERVVKATSRHEEIAQKLWVPSYDALFRL